MGLIDIAYLKAYDATFTEYFVGLRRTEAPEEPISSRSAEKAENSRVRSALSIAKLRSSIIEVAFVALFKKIMNFVQERHRDAFKPKIGPLRQVLYLITPYINFVLSLGTLFLTILFSMSRSNTTSPYLAFQKLMLVKCNSHDLQRYSTVNLTSRLLKSLGLGLVISTLCEWYFGRSGEAPETRVGARGQRVNLSQRQFYIPAPPVAEEREIVHARHCPICKNIVTNHTLNAVSGQIFCYLCIKAHVDEKGTCPVTGLRTEPSQLRRLYIDG